MKKDLNEYGQTLITAIIIGIVCALLLLGNRWFNAIGVCADSAGPNKLHILESREKPVLFVTLTNDAVDVGTVINLSKDGYAISNEYYELYAESRTDTQILDDGSSVFKNITDTITVSCNKGEIVLDEETNIKQLILSDAGEYKITFSVVEKTDELDSGNVYFASETKTIILNVY